MRQQDRLGRSRLPVFPRSGLQPAGNRELSVLIGLATRRARSRPQPLHRAICVTLSSPNNRVKTVGLLGIGVIRTEIKARGVFEKPTGFIWNYPNTTSLSLGMFGKLLDPLP